MSNADTLIGLLRRHEQVKYDTIAKRCKVKNVPDCVMKVRSKGYVVQSIWATTKNGKKHVIAYALKGLPAT